MTDDLDRFLDLLADPPQPTALEARQDPCFALGQPEALADRVGCTVAQAERAVAAGWTWVPADWCVIPRDTYQELTAGPPPPWWRTGRTARLLRRLWSRCYTLGITSNGPGWCWDTHGEHLTHRPRLRGSRPYVLGVKRETWRCWLHGHRRGEPVGFGYCGRCVPWPCCGATTLDHHPDCKEA